MAIIGVDIGTTSVKTVVIRRSNAVVVGSSSDYHCASLSTLPGFDEQCPLKIVASFLKCLSRYENDTLAKVKLITFCGQMHGVVLWSCKLLKNVFSQGLEGYLSGVVNSATTGENMISSLITWQDKRVHGAELDALNDIIAKFDETCSNKLHSGYGCATLAWMIQHKRAEFERYDRCGTIQDFFVWLFTSRSEADVVSMSPQNAASWGYFDLSSRKWNSLCIEMVEIPVGLMPTIVGTKTIVGSLTFDLCGLQKGTNVAVALGDFQCSVFSQLKPQTAVMNIGTSSQLAFKLDVNNNVQLKSLPSSVDMVPYFDENSCLAVAASLNGGNVIESFVQFFVDVIQQCIPDLELDKIAFRSTLLKPVDKECSHDCVDPSNCENLVIVPTLFGERYNTSACASVTGITPASLTPSQILNAMARGIVQNLNQMLPTSILKDHGISAVIASGQAASPLYADHIEALYRREGIDVLSGGACDAALGAAMFGRSLLT